MKTTISTMFFFFFFSSPSVSKSFYDLSSLYQVSKNKNKSDQYKLICREFKGAYDKTAPNKSELFVSIVASIWLDSLGQSKSRADLRRCELIHIPLVKNKTENLAYAIETEFKKQKFKKRTAVCRGIVDVLQKPSIFSIVCLRHFFRENLQLMHNFQYDTALNNILNHPAFDIPRLKKRKDFKILRAYSEGIYPNKALELATKIRGYTKKENTSDLFRVSYYEAKALADLGRYQEALDKLDKYDIPHPKLEKRLSISYAYLKSQLYFLLNKSDLALKEASSLKSKVLSITNAQTLSYVIPYWHSIFAGSKFRIKKEVAETFRLDEKNYFEHAIKLCVLLSDSLIKNLVPQSTKKKCTEIALKVDKNLKASPIAAFIIQRFKNSEDYKGKVDKLCSMNRYRYSFDCQLVSRLQGR